MPVLTALGEEFGREKVFETARRTWWTWRGSGQGAGRAHGRRRASHFATALEDWKKGDACAWTCWSEPRRSSLNVRAAATPRCTAPSALPEIGALLSCNRDFSLVEGFNPDVKLTRTQTVMEGASHCDFRFELRRPKQDAPIGRPGPRDRPVGPGMTMSENR